MKRLNAPKVWRVPRKKEEWAVKASPGPHSLVDSLPLSVSLRDNLKLVRTKKESEKILGRGEVEVDGKIRKDSKYPVGLMDVVGIPKTGDNWRVLSDLRGYLRFREIEEEEAKFKLGKVVGKTQVKGGDLQLTLHDGKTVVGEFNNVGVGDTVKVSLPELEVEDHISRGEGKLVFITGGSNVGRKGRIKKVLEVEGPYSDKFVIEADGEEFQSPEQYVFVIGDEEAEISLLEED